MKNLVKKWTDVSLVVRIVIGLIIGIILGLVVPQAQVIGLLGTVFISALKGVAPLLVFILVLSSLANATNGIGNRFRTVIFFYMLSTLLAAVIAVFVSFAFPVTMALDVAAADSTPPSGLGAVMTNLLTKLVDNPINALTTANYIGILFWAVIFGLGLKKFASSHTLHMMEDLADMVSSAVRWIIQCAPFGILGIVYSTVSEGGLGVFASYAKLLVVLVGCMLSVALVVDPLLVFLFLKRNPYPLVFRCLRQSGLTAFFTRSSAANIPVNMELCEQVGLDRDFYSVSIPLGATINMDGAAITITIMSLAVCHTVGVAVDIPTAIILSVIATLGACGASGVAGGSLLLIPMACSLFGVGNDIAMQAVAVGFIIGVIQDSVETALNSSGDVMFTVSAECYDKKKKGEPMPFFDAKK